MFAPHRRWFAVYCAALLASAWHPSASAEEPSLAALVPADVGLCVEFDNAGQHAVELTESELFHRIGAFPPLARWHADLHASLPRLATHVQQLLGSPAGELRQRLFGGQALIAIWPAGDGPADRPILLLFRADDADYLRRTLDGIFAAQERSGMLIEARQADHAGTTYRARTLRRGQSRVTMYLAQFDRVGVLSSDEAVLQGVIDRESAAELPTGSLADLPAYREATARLSTTARTRAFVNPRAWDQEVSRHMSSAAAEPPVDERPLLAVWKSARYWAASFDVVPRPTFESFMALDPAALPERVRQTLNGVSGATQFANHLPADSLLAVAGRVELTTLAAGLRPTKDAASQSGSAELPLLAELAGQSLGGLGPDVGACLLLATRPAKFPFDWAVGAASASTGPGGVQPGIADDRRDGLRAALTLALPRSPGPSPLREVEFDGLSAFAFPRPRDRGELFVAFDPTCSALWAASSSAALSRAATLPPGESLADSPAFVELQSPRIPAPGLMLYADCAGLRKLAAEYRASLVEFLTADKRVDRARAERSVSEFLSLTSLTDRLLVSAAIDEQGIALSVTASYDQPTAVRPR